MATLGDGQFEIDGATFAGVWDNTKLRKIEWPDVSWSTQDSDNQFRPGIVMGKDLLRPGLIDFSLVTDAYTVDDAKDAAERLGYLWLRGGDRSPNSISTLRYRVGARTRRVYGRGRDFSHKLDQWTYSGTSPITCSFKMVDPFFYDDEEQSVAVGYTPEVTGGLVAPLSAPLTSTGTGAASVGGFIPNVGGTASTPVVVTLTGPTQYAKVFGDGWKIHYEKPIAADEVVTIDCRFGHTMAFNNFGRVLNGNLSWDTQLSKARITPGTETITYMGYDLTGQSRALVTWRSAYHTW